MIEDSHTAAGGLLLEVNNLFRARGWHDSGHAALAIVEYMMAGGSLDPTSLKKAISVSFTSVNHTTKAEVVEAVGERLTNWRAPSLVASVSPRTLLLLSADPLDQAPLLIQREQREIRDQIDRSPLQSKISLELRPGLVYTELARYLLETNPTVVHFSGHGSVDGLFAEDALGGSRLLSASALSALFRQPAVQRTVQLVVLNACFSSVQARALSRWVPAVMGMRSGIEDSAAVSFAGGLYMALGQGVPVAEAFDWGRAAITVEGLADAQLPQLIATGAGRAMRVF